MALLYVIFTHKTLDTAAKFLFKMGVADFVVKLETTGVKFTLLQIPLHDGLLLGVGGGDHSLSGGDGALYGLDFGNDIFQTRFC